MFKQIKTKIKLMQALKILAILNQIKIEDDLLDYIFTMNAKSLIPLQEKFNDLKSGLILQFASEKDGVLQKTGGEYIYSKENQKLLEDAIKAEGEKEYEVEILQIDITNRKQAKSLNRIIKYTLLGTVFSMEIPEDKGELKPEPAVAE
jgi:hypothetical protein